jgi:hemerythrin
MAAIIWDDKVLGPGVATVDEQHKKLIEMINELMDATSAGRGKEEIGHMMDFLARYAVEHFGHEENVMSTHKCPAAEANKEAHAKFLQDFTALKARFDAEGPTLAVVMEVQKRVVNWLTQHIKGCDTQLRKCRIAK